MRLRFLLGLSALLFGTAALSGQPPAPKVKPIPVAAPGVAGGEVVLAGSRDQLRAGPGVKTARMHPSLRAGIKSGAVPIPASWDWTKGDTTKLPLLGNGTYGNCYMVAPAHVFQLYGGMQGVPVVFDEQTLVKRYLILSGGDNGLDDGTIFPEIKRAYIGPGGPHKMLDVLVAPSSDPVLIDTMGYLFGPQMFTFTVYSNFMSVRPGSVLDGNSGGMEGGHAVVMSGKTATGRRKLETWGIQPSVQVTQKWITGVDPEFVSCFSLEWFDSKGYAPNGQHYNTLAPLWNSFGGNVPTTGPFPSPTPTPPVPPIPVPPTPTPTPVTTGLRGPDQRLNFNIYNPKTGEITGSSFIEKNSLVLLPFAAGQKTPDLNGFTGTLTYEGGVLTAVAPGDAPASFGRVKWLQLVRDGAKLWADIQAANIPAMVPLVEKFWTDLSSFNVAALAADVRAILAAADAANYAVIVADVRAVLADLGLSFGALGIQESELVAPKAVPKVAPPKLGKPYPVAPRKVLAPRGLVPGFAH